MNLLSNINIDLILTIIICEYCLDGRCYKLHFFIKHNLYFIKNYLIQTNINITSIIYKSNKYQDISKIIHFFKFSKVKKKHHSGL